MGARILMKGKAFKHVYLKIVRIVNVTMVILVLRIKLILWKKKAQNTRYFTFCKKEKKT
jgi:hypothetical protein